MDDTILVTFDRKLESLRTKRLNPKSARLRNMVIRQECEAMWESADWPAVSKLKKLKIQKGKRLEITAAVYRKIKIRDKDNLESSFNKLIVDGLPRLGIVPSDSDSHVVIRAVYQYPAKDNEGMEVVNVWFSVEKPLDKGLKYV